MRRLSSSKSQTPPPGSDLPLPRCRTGNPSLTGASSRARRRNSPTASGRWRGGATTPLLRWKLEGAGPAPEIAKGKARRNLRNAAGEAAEPLAVSARKLAAGLWKLQLPEVGGEREGRGAPIGFAPNPRHLYMPNVCDHNRTGIPSRTRNELASSPKNGAFHKVESCAASTHPDMEMATKWDNGCLKTSDEIYQVFSNLKLHKDQQVTTSSVATCLQAELGKAHSRISDLEAERRSSKKKLDDFLRKLAEEKASWRSREHEKMSNIIDAIKHDLNRERKIRQRMEIVNSKLVDELAEAKLSTKRYLQDYEKERKARELMEEVCDELAKEIGEDKAEVEALKRESMKMREEVEEERKMLQMAEVWREERVQMKLVDAKLTLEQKYTQLSKLLADLESFLKGKGGSDADSAAAREAEMLREMASSVKVHDIKEFSYQPPPASEDIFSVFEELQPRADTKEREIEECYGCSSASHASKMHMVSPETDVFLEPVNRYANGTTKRNGAVEDDSEWETVSNVEEQGSSNSPDGSDPSVNGIYEESDASVSGTDWDENGESGTLLSEISAVCSTTNRQYRKKGSSIARLWRSSAGENCKKMVVELPNGMPTNGRKSNATLSPGIKSGEVGLSSPSVGQLSSPDSLNPHVSRGKKGYIKWPGSMQKNNLKAKLQEARIESQKIQLRHALKQKI
ncbi:uncharacterized protein [Typha latifolia]|uniref:uncharacterized protein n=1 Tax=Typha latifolia TaxID=4733 RepID=UPI003C2B0770